MQSRCTFLPVRLRLAMLIGRRWPFSRGRHRLVAALLNETFTWPTSVTISFPEGVMKNVDLANAYAFYRDLLLFGEMDAADIGCVRRLLRSGDVVVDAGANLGYYSLVSSRVVGSSGQVWAFEPIPEVWTRLQSNITASKADNVTGVCLALGDGRGEITLHRFEGYYSGGWFSIVSALPDRPSTSAYTVPVMPLDDYLKQERVEKVSVLKVDVEGSELPVFRGAAQLLSQPEAPIILFEYNPLTQTRAGYLPEDILTYLGQFGYVFYRATIRRHPVLERWSSPGLVAFDPASVSEDSNPNVWCLKAKHREHAGSAGLISLSR